MKGLPIFWTRMAVELIPMSLYQFYTHTPRVLPIHFGRETVPSVILHECRLDRHERLNQCWLNVGPAS